MSLLRKVVGPKSKYNKDIAYAYLAKVYTVNQDDRFCRYYYGDTICSLIEYLIENDIAPDEVRMFGMFKGDEVPVDLKCCTSSSGEWLLKPELCRSLEEHYLESFDKIYRGHVEIGECSFEDREENII